MSSDPVNNPRHVKDRWDRYRLDDLLRGKLITRTGAREGTLLFGFMPGGGPLDYVGILQIALFRLDEDKRYKVLLHCDYLPAAEDEALLFMLCNVYGTDQGPPESEVGSANLTIVSIPEGTDEVYQKPQWSLGVFRFRAEWDSKDGWWGNGAWKREESIAVGFREPFRVLGRGDDYCFLTDSGKLYRSPPARPERGKGRAMEAAWDDPTRPVVAFISNADADRTFLFCKPDKQGKGVYFEMAAKPDLRPYDAGKVPQAKPDDPLPAVLAYAKILLADKMIKDKE